MKTLENILCFRTENDLTVDDVILLTSSVNKIYNIFYSNNIFKRLLKEQEEQYIDNLDKCEEMMHNYMRHPIYRDFYHIQKELLKEFRKNRKELNSFTQCLPFQLFQPIEIKIPQPFDIYSNLYLYQDENEKLRIDKIHISSPGGFSFTGLGDVIRELRELIKDIWFRNNQEKQMGNLEIFEKKLKIYGSFDGQMTGELQDAINKIELLVSKNKFLDIGENIDNRPRCSKDS